MLVKTQNLEILISAESTDLIIGEYLADIIITTSNFNDVILPVSLIVGETQLNIGDLNNDNVYNIQDVILLVSVVLSSSDYNILGDLNFDGMVDVIDVVLLVGIILNE